MGMIPSKPKDYSDGRTKQSFKDGTDINKLLSKSQRADTLSHLAKYEPQYGDFSDFDFDSAQRTLARARSIFAEVPSEVRKEFNQDPREFFAFVNDPANADQLARVLPELAAPGRQRRVLNLPPAGPRTAEAVEPAEPASRPVVESSPPETPSENA